MTAVLTTVAIWSAGSLTAAIILGRATRRHQRGEEAQA